MVSSKRFETKTTLTAQNGGKYYRTAVPNWIVEQILGLKAKDKVLWKVDKGKVWIEKA